MGFFSRLLGLSVRCPRCGKAGARETATGYRCANQNCRYYDAALARQLMPRLHRPRAADAPPPDFSNPLVIRYQNWRGERKDFTCDRRSLIMRRQHLLACVAPEGITIALATARIANWPEVKGLVRPAQAVTARAARPAAGAAPEKRAVPALASETASPPDFTNPLQIEYLNWQNEYKEFTAARASLAIKRDRLLATLAPAGVRAAFRLDRIQNLPALRAATSLPAGTH